MYLKTNKNINWKPSRIILLTILLLIIIYFFQNIVVTEIFVALYIFSLIILIPTMNQNMGKSKGIINIKNIEKNQGNIIITFDTNEKMILEINDITSAVLNKRIIKNYAGKFWISIVILKRYIEISIKIKGLNLLICSDDYNDFKKMNELYKTINPPTVSS